MPMSEVRFHVYTAGMQPATNYVDHSAGEPMRFKCSPHVLRWFKCSMTPCATGARTSTATNMPDDRDQDQFEQRKARVVCVRCGAVIHEAPGLTVPGLCEEHGEGDCNDQADRPAGRNSKTV